MILLYHLVEVLGLAQFNINKGVDIDAANGSSVGTAFVYGDIFRQAMQIYGARQVEPRSRQISLGGEQEVHCVAALVDCAVKLLPLAGNLAVSLIHLPTGTDWALTATKDMHHDWEYLLSPSVHGGVLHEDATLLHHFFQMANALGVSCIKTGAYLHRFARIMQALEYPAQFANHRGFGHILHPATFMRGCLLRQNHRARPEYLQSQRSTDPP